MCISNDSHIHWVITEHWKNHTFNVITYKCILNTVCLHQAYRQRIQLKLYTYFFSLLFAFTLNYDRCFSVLYFCLILPHFVMVASALLCLDGKREQQQRKKKIQYFLNAQCHTSYYIYTVYKYIKMNKIYFETTIRI